MHRFEMALDLIGVGVWFLAQTLVAIVLCAVLAIPFAVLFVFDAIAGALEPRATLQLVPPAPPRRPFAAPLPARRAA